jgi:FtsP/CotA-like multicopper oxidase with cupredoxin domain
MVRIGQMASPKFPLHRRELIIGLGAVAVSQGSPTVLLAQNQKTLVLWSGASDPVEPGKKPSPVWGLSGPPVDHGSVILKRGDTLVTRLMNYLPVPAVLNLYGIDGVPGAEPLLSWKPSAATYGMGEDVHAPLRHAGTYLFDLGLLADGQDRPTRALPLVVHEREPIQVDRDVLFFVEERRLQADGMAVAPGIEPKGTTTTFLGTTTTFGIQSEVWVRANERLRIRFINGSHRSVIAVKIERFDVWIMAIDGQPAEPFQTRNGAFVLPPRGRVDVFVDATAPAGTTSQIFLHDGKEARQIGKLGISSEPPTRPAPLPLAPPLPSNGLPERLDLKGATRADLALGAPQGDWVPPVNFAVTAPPAFRTKAGRTVVLALTNRGTIANVFHLHGHHFRLLDRLDDGWKPFWLDTLAIEPGQTQRIAFAAEYAGRWLIESVATDWAAPRLVRWYSVE